MSYLYQLVWSDDLETLAKRLIQDYEKNIGTDPFATSCIITGNPLRGNWLHRFFVQHAPQNRPIVANLDFQLLYPFVNDWLYAAFEKKDICSRRPLEHPYSKQILQWRIYHILSSSSIRHFPDLEYYLGKHPSSERVFRLAGTLAQFFDTYQVRRPEMLNRWETSPRSQMDKTEAWQCRLWQLLIKQSPDTYLSQFSTLQNQSFDLTTAFRYGIPQYRSVHVFGVSDIPRPFLAFFQRLSEFLPVFIYQFNPCREMWLDDEVFSKALRKEVDQKLSKGELSPMGDDISLENRLAENSHPVLGRLGIAAQGSLGYLLDQCNGNVEQPLLPPPPRDTLLHRFQSHILERRTDLDCDPPLSPNDTSIRIHAAHNPRRELEVVRNQIIDYLAQHTECSPRDILVLLADWDTYSPFIAGVFETAYVAPPVGAPSDAAPRTLPIRIAGSREYETPSAFRAIQILLECLDNRLPVEKVVALLSEESVGPHFGIRTEDIPTLKKILKDANVRWGMDDEYIAGIYGTCCNNEESRARSQSPVPANATENIFPFSWRRGLDRLLLGQLLGENTDQQAAGLSQAPISFEAHLLGEEPSFFSHPVFGIPILPCRMFGKDALPLIGGLDSFLYGIKRLRAFFQTPGSIPSIEVLQTILLEAVDVFFDPDQDPDSLSVIRQTIVTVLNRVAIAERLNGKNNQLTLALIREALANELSSTSTAHPAIGQDAIVFAPLRMENAFPARFVWICGLNNGSFPKQEQFFSFDLIARHRTFLDPNQHEKDSFALLEAILSARDTLGFSFLGRNEKTNDPLPASPLLVNQIDYLNRHFFQNSDIPVVVHRLQAFHPSYFSKETAQISGYSISRSESDFKIAKAIRAKQGKPSVSTPHPTRALVLPDEIDIETLDDILLNPNEALLRQITPRPTLRQNIQLDSIAQTSVTVHNRLAFYDNSDKDKENFYRQYAVLQWEKGKAPSVTNAFEYVKRLDEKGMTDTSSSWFRLRNRNIALSKTKIKDGKGCFSFSETYLADLYRIGIEEFPREAFTLSFTDPVLESPKELTILWQPKIAPFQSDGQTQTNIQVFLDEWNGDTTYRGNLRHLVACASGKDVVTALISMEPKKEATIKLLLPMPQNEAIEKLRQMFTALLTPQDTLFPTSNTPYAEEERILAGYSCAPRRKENPDSFLDILKNAIDKNNVLSPAPQKRNK